MDVVLMFQAKCYLFPFMGLNKVDIDVLKLLGYF